MSMASTSMPTLRCADVRRVASARCGRGRGRKSHHGRLGCAEPSTSCVSEERAVEFVDARVRWRGHDVHYVRCGSTRAAKHVLLLPGFGVGAFHYEALSRGLGAEEDTCVWAIDFVGQGESWPSEDDAVEVGFRYSVETWAEQVEFFLREVVQTECFLVGNSLGGYVSTLVAARSRSLVRGLMLLNATPFWAFVPNDPNSIGSRIAPWRGELPAPKWISGLISTYWQSFRSEANVRGLLSLVYSNPSVIDDELVRNIIKPTDNANALSTFCSVVWSPKSALSFDEMLERIRADDSLPVALMYGKEDPWVVPLWGQRLKRAVPRADYYEISPCGHCPAHERPETLNDLISSYMSYCHAGKSGEPPRGSTDGFASLVDGSPRNIFERIDALRAAA